MNTYIFWTSDPVELQHWIVVLMALGIPYSCEGDESGYNIIFESPSDSQLPFEFQDIIN